MSLKEKLPGVFGDENPKDLKNVIVSVDTNILLSLLTINQKAFEDLYNIFKELNDKDQMFLTHHVAEEYALGSEDVCRKDGKIYSEVENKIDKFLKIDPVFENEYKERVKDYKKITEEFNKLKKEFKTYFKKELMKINYNQRGKLIEELFKNTGNPYNKKDLYEIYKEIDFRYAASIPPGFKDKTKDNGNKYGDCLVWFQLMDYAKGEKKDIVYVTTDVKEDWVIEGKFRKELYNEFYNETKQHIFMYNPTDFVKIYQQLTGTKTKKVKPIPDYTTLIRKTIDTGKGITVVNAFDKIQSYDFIPVPKYTGVVDTGWKLYGADPYVGLKDTTVIYTADDYIKSIEKLYRVSPQFDFTYDAFGNHEETDNDKNKDDKKDSGKK